MTNSKPILSIPVLKISVNMEFNPNGSNTVTSFQFLNTSIPQVLISSQQTIIIQILNSFSRIYVPLTMILAFVNNSVCLLVFFVNKEFYEKTSKNSRIYYILLAFADIAANYSYGLPTSLGDGLYTLTNGKVAM